MVKGPWKRAYRCTACKAPISNHEKYYSYATCPKCGFISKGTICDTDDFVYRRVRQGRWWQFWKPVTTEWKKP